MSEATCPDKESVDRGKRAMRVGMVVSDKGDKTITVECHRIMRHQKYGKYMRRRSKLRAHDEKNEAKVGDRVKVAACRRLSKTKYWRLVEVVSSL